MTTTTTGETVSERPNFAEVLAEVRLVRDGAALRLPYLTGESAATIRGWVAACDEVLDLIAALATPTVPTAEEER